MPLVLKDQMSFQNLTAASNMKGILEQQFFEIA